jgi:uncharacterized protein YigA (DUF484 family)
MTGLVSEDVDGAAVPAWGVARALLLSNPDLMLDDTQLLQALGLRPHADNVLDFGPAALARLQAANAKEITAREEVESLARANYTAQVETHAMVIDLLEARDNADLANRVNDGARRRFGLDVGAVALEGHAPAGWRTLPSGFLDYVLGPDETCAVGPCTGGREIFGEAAERVKSVALVRIGVFEPARHGVLAFGSSDADTFSTDMGVELIAFLARVVERTAARWPILV